VNVRLLYERLIALSGHVKVFEAEAIPLPRAQRGQEEDDEDEEKETKVVIEEPTLARQLFETGYKDLKSKNPKNEVYFRNVGHLMC